MKKLYGVQKLKFRDMNILNPNQVYPSELNCHFHYKIKGKVRRVTKFIRVYS